MMIKNVVLAVDTDVSVVVGLYDYHSGTRMVIADGESYYFASSSLIKVGDSLQHYTFADIVRLDSYEISQSLLKPGEEVVITLTWQVLKSPDADYTIFVQLLDPTTARKAAASDSQPPGGTHIWQAGSRIVDVHRMTIASDAPPSVYTVMIGLYRRTESGGFDRLRLTSDHIDTDQDVLYLTPIRVVDK